MERSSLTYGSVTLQKHDIRLLSGNFWLNDQCLSFYLEYLTRKYANSRILLLEPSACFLIALETDPEDLKIGLNRLDFATPDLFFLPINDNSDAEASGGSHWTLLVLCKQTWTGYHYNSTGTGGNNLYQAQLVAQKLAGVLGVDGEVVIREVEVVPGQSNGFDCGVYVLWIVEMLLKDLLLEGSRQGSGLFAASFVRVAPSEVQLKRREIYGLVQGMMRV